MKKRLSAVLLFTCVICIILSFCYGILYGNRNMFISCYSGLVLNIFVLYVYISVKELKKYRTSCASQTLNNIKDLINIKLNKGALPETTEFIIRRDGKNYISYRRYDDKVKNSLLFIKIFSCFICIVILVPFFLGMLPLPCLFDNEKIYNLFCNMSLSEFVIFFTLIAAGSVNIFIYTSSIFEEKMIEFLVIDLNNNCNVIQKNIDEAYSKTEKCCIHKEEIVEVGKNSFLITQYTKQSKTYVFFVTSLVVIVFVELIYLLFISEFPGAEDIFISLFPSISLIFISVITNDNYDKRYYKHELKVEKSVDEKEEVEYIESNKRLIFNSRDNKGEYTGSIYIKIIEPHELILRRIGIDKIFK